MAAPSPKPPGGEGGQATAPLPPVFDSRTCFQIGFGMLAAAAAAFNGFCAAQRAQPVGGPMNSESEIWLGIIAGFVSLGLLFVGRGLTLHPGTRGRWWKFLALAAALGILGFAGARYYRIITLFWRGALFGVGATIFAEMLRRLAWGRYDRRKRSRAAAPSASKALAVVRSSVVTFELEQTIEDLLFLKVTNHGPEAVFAAKLGVGEQSMPARWASGSATESLPTDKTGRILLAKFVPHLIPAILPGKLGSWIVYGLSNGKPSELRLPAQTDFSALMGGAMMATITFTTSPELPGGPFACEVDLRSATASAKRITTRLQRL